MSNYTEAPQAKKEEEDDTSIAPASIALSTELPTLRRSARTPSLKKFDRLLLSDEEVVEYEEPTSKSEAATKSTKRKKGDPASGPSAKKKKLKRGYAEPEQYAHLNELPDILAPELDVLFCGINPGQYSATVGHHFASPRNQFWRCLHDAGKMHNKDSFHLESNGSLELTGNKLVPASDDHTLPKRFSLGLTNLVHRPTAEQNELSDKELRAGVPAFLSKVAEYRPHVVCFVGLGIAKTVKACCLPVPVCPPLSQFSYSDDHQKGAEGRGTARVGFQPFKLVYVKDPETSVHETLFYALPSTSGRVVQFQREDKAMLLRELKTKLIDIKTGQFDTNYMHTVSAHMPTV
ncbi:hypothetical protein M378DRAFT_11630 [Amanita muscaria Koide BX008]|uniref:Uracil-DNA glycosylase-like domain-containing protein n=1 Tax=Amanita muscaria (strain Koide BX008) TaxID=946122 RepID=A0A0C2WRF5_AMAMK|nr:hypothetical protein M378DRAFT_11630 [Amanita muscaria Koide BX008]